MSDKIVTHEDLAAIEALGGAAREWSKQEAIAVKSFLSRLRAAAKADAPPLPEGWAIRTHPNGDQEACYSHGDGTFSVWLPADDRSVKFHVGDWPHVTFTPLRPTITEADAERAAVVLMDRIPTQTYRDVTRDMLKAAGIEVQP